MENENSTVNQEIKRKFVDREVICNLSMFVEDIIKADENLDLYGEIENLYEFTVELSDGKEFIGGEDDKEELQEELETKLEDLEEAMSETYSDELEALKEKISSLEDDILELGYAESEPQEIFEWWSVSGFLFRDLRSKGEPILETHGHYLWGRCCCGQAILLDHVISEICYDMEILEGQRNDWSKHD